MPRRSVKWLTRLDVDLARKNCHIDIYRDWHRDPWSWPEIDWVAKRRPGILEERLLEEGARQVAKLDVANENYSVRPAVVMDPVDRLAYQALVDSLSQSLIGGLPAWVYGPRLHVRTPRPGIYGRGDLQWQYFRTHLKARALRDDAALKTDIVSFFSSTPVARVIDQVEARAGSTPAVERLSSMLTAWDQAPGRSGLTQRFVPSSVLATMYLAPVDDVLRRYALPRRRRKLWFPDRVLRWMDDIWVFGDDPSLLWKAQLELQEAMRDLGLQMGLGKTRVLEGEAVEREVQRREHSAVDVELSEDDGSSEALDELLDRLLERPEIADRTSISFATNRMRRHQLFERVHEFVEAAPRMPHAADLLARLFRASEWWHDLGPWYVDYSQSAWGAIDWSVAQLGTMFPSNQRPPAGVADFLAEAAHQRGSLAITTLGAERLASWEPSSARALLREMMHTASQPLSRRSVALAALAAGEDRGIVSKMLGEHSENQVTLAMLRDRRFRKVKTQADFRGD